MSKQYFYICTDWLEKRQYCKIGITRYPRARLFDYSNFHICKFALLVEFEISRADMVELEKQCLWATRKYYLTSRNCSIEGRAGPVDEIVKICRSVIADFPAECKYITYNEDDYDNNSEIGWTALMEQDEHEGKIKAYASSLADLAQEVDITDSIDH